MGWRTIVVNEHSKLSYQNHHLVFTSRNVEERFHISEIDTLILETTNISITTMLLSKLVEGKVLLIFCDEKRLPVGKISPFYGRHDSSLQLSRQVEWNLETQKFVWTEIISQKILNQQTFLREQNFSEKADAILRLHEKLELFDPTNREGHAARIFFNSLFGNDFSRNDENDINAGLDYGYTLLMSLFAREIVKNGCMTQFGLKHANQFNDYNLASDLMEPFRIIVDKIVYECRNENFKFMKYALFEMFNQQYSFNGKEMFLTNIVSGYTKKVISALNNQNKGVPTFRI